MTFAEAPLLFDVPVRTRLKWYDDRKGYGFVVTDSGEDAFLHASALRRAGVTALSEGACLLCHLTYGQKGIQVAAIHDIISAGMQPRPIAVTPAITRTTGVIKWFRPERGYGFITADDGGKDVFVSGNCLYSLGPRDIVPGMRVMIAVKTVPKGREAVKVELLDKEPDWPSRYLSPYEDTGT